MRQGGTDGKATELERDARRASDGLRQLLERVADRALGHPGVVRVQAVMDTYDRAGGGLVASGLAYTSLLALLPGLMLALSAVGFLIQDPEIQRHIVSAIERAVPPLKEVAAAAFEQVARGAVPTGVIAIVTLFWGSSRFYANLDTAFSRIFSEVPRRNPVVQTVRGVLLTVLLVFIPMALVIVRSAMVWVTQFAPDGIDVGAFLALLIELASPVGLVVAFGAAVALCYRFVPNEHVPWRSLLLPSAIAGLVLAVFAQLYVFIFPRLVGMAHVYGTALALFALLAWMSIAFNVLLLGAAWTEVRLHLGPYRAPVRRGPGPRADEGPV